MIPLATRPQISPARRFFYQVYVVFLLGTGAVLLLPNTSFGVQEADNRLFSAVWIALHLASIVILLSGRWAFSQLLAAPVMLGLLATISSLWSVDPLASLLYGGMLTGNILVAQRLAQEMSPREILAMLSNVIVFLCAIGILLYFAGWDAVVWYDTRSRENFFGGEFLRGLFPHRISGSIYAIVGLIGSLATKRGVPRVIALAVTVIFLLLSASATGYILAIVALGSYALFLLGHRSKTTTAAFFVTRGAAMVLVAVLVWMTWESLLGILGRDPTLTARTLLWEWGIQAWQIKPVLGWGYNSYFESDHAAYAHALSAELKYYDVPHFHQSFIQTAVDLGLVGLVMVSYIAVKAVIGSYKLGVSQSREGAAFFSFSVALVIAAFTGYVFPEYNYFATFLLVLAYYVSRPISSSPSRRASASESLKPSASRD